MGNFYFKMQNTCVQKQRKIFESKMVSQYFKKICCINPLFKCRVRCRLGVGKVSGRCRENQYIRMILDYLTKCVTYMSQCVANMPQCVRIKASYRPPRHPIDTTSTLFPTPSFCCVPTLIGSNPPFSTLSKIFFFLSAFNNNLSYRCRYFNIQI